VFHKIKAIDDFFKSQYRRGLEIEIYKTSITEKFFFSTYSLIGKILKLLFNTEERAQIEEKELPNINNEIKMLLNMEKDVYYDKEILSHALNFKFDEVSSHIDRLLQINFVQSNETLNSFKLTERSYFFKIGLENELSSAIKDDFERNIESFHIFLSLNKITV